MRSFSEWKSKLLQKGTFSGNNNSFLTQRWHMTSEVSYETTCMLALCNNFYSLTDIVTLYGEKIEIIIHKFKFSCIVHYILPLFVPCLSLHSYDNHNQYLLHFTSVDGICSIQGSDFSIHINCFVNSPIKTTVIQSMQAIFASSIQCTSMHHIQQIASLKRKRYTKMNWMEMQWNYCVDVLFGWWRAVGAQSHCDTVNSREVIVLYWSGIYYFSVMAEIRSLWRTDLH